MKKICSIVLVALLVMINVPCNLLMVYAISAPSGLVLNDRSDTVASFRWNSVSGAVGYEIYSDGQLIGEAPILGGYLLRQYIATELVPMTQYNFTVKAKDAQGILSPASSVLTVNTYSAYQSVNIALGKTASSDCIYNSAFAASNAVDGNINDYINIRPMWLSSVTAAPHWVKVDLGSSQRVKKFVIVHGPASGYSGHSDTYLRDYIIQGSNDNSVWSDLVTIIDNTATGTTTHDIQPVAYRYFRINITRASDVGFAGVCDFRIYSANELDSVHLNLTKDKICVGGTSNAIATGSLTDGTSADLTTAAISYISNNTSVATVDASTGLITAVSLGTANISVSVTLDGITKNATMPVTVVLPAPTGLILNEKSDTAVSFRWSSVSNAALYEIYRNGELVGTSPIIGGYITTQYIATGLTSSTHYSFTVKTKDALGNSSIESSVLAVATASINESTNQALGKSVTADCIYNAGFAPTNVVDGNIKDYVNIRPMWLTNLLGTPHWLTVDMGSATNVSKFLITHGPASGYSGHSDTYLRDFKIQGSNDNSLWNDLLTVTDNTISDTTTHEIMPQSYRYFRVYITRAGVSGFAGICEFRIYLYTPTLNVSTDLVDKGIATTNLNPNQPALDARPLLNAAVTYAKNNGIKVITANPGNYYFLTLQAYDRHLEINGLNDATIDFQGANLYFSSSNVSGIVAKNCQRLKMKNFTVDYSNLPFTQIRVSAVNASTREITYELLPGWASPETFNANRSPYGGDRICMFVFRNGSRVTDVGRLIADRPVNSTTIHVNDDGKKTTRQANLALIMPGDYITYANRSGGYGIKIEGGDENNIENISIYAAGQFGLYIDTQKDNIIDKVSIVPRTGTDRLISSNGDGIHLARARENNIVQNCMVKGTCDDGIAVNNSVLAILNSQSGNRNVTVNRYQKGYFYNGQNVTFMDPVTCNNVFTAVISTQNPPVEQQLIQANEQIVLTLDRDVPVLPAAAEMFSDVPSERGSGTTIINNSIEKINLGRGIYIAGIMNAKVIGNNIKYTNMSGININEEIMPVDWKFPSNDNITIEKNTLDNSFMWGAPEGGFVNTGASLLVNSYNINGSWATGMPNTDIFVNNNIVKNSARTAIRIENVDCGQVRNNVVTNACQYPWPFWMGIIPDVEAEFRQPIVIKTVNDVNVFANEIN